ncbi:serine hydrolase domain-containing protein [Flavobacterium sp. RNTU_13]|uniref:serine hydrolase domain-containing protein n=1 Tax=Flavobacterium sp. RNTU_13 TaxID=3375145 RepID=UPI003985769D
MNKSLLVVTLLASSFFAHAQDYFAPVDSIVKTYEGKEVPGFSVRILKDGKTVYNNHAGYANLEKHIKITDETVFNLGSTSKQFTAACVVLLQQQGKLNLNDNLRKYIPEFPAYAEKITLLHLLTHTSGLKDYPILATIKGEESDDYTNNQIKEMMVLQEPDFAPGEKWSYCNTGYWCLAQIVEKVSGKSIGEFARKNIFKPLGMKSTAYVTKPKNNVDHKAIGYEMENGAYKTTDPDQKAVGGGGIYSTLGDLQKWLTEMQTHRVFGDAFWKSMTQDDAYKNENLTYTKGLFISPYGSKTMIQHGGDVKGYHPFLAYFPDDKVGAVILTNDDSFKRYDILKAAVNRLLGFPYRYPTAKNGSVKQANLSMYTGKYKLDEGQYIVIQEGNGVLSFMQLWDGTNVKLKPNGQDNTFALEEDQGVFVFENIQNGKAESIQLQQGAGKASFIRVETMPEKPEYKMYEGTYYSAALKQNVQIFTKEGLVYMKLANGDQDWGIEAEEATFATRYGDLSFRKDAQGNITGFTYNHERAKNIEFSKQKSE